MQRPSLLKILAYGAAGFAGYQVLRRNPRLLKLAAGYIGGYIGQNFLNRQASEAPSSEPRRPIYEARPTRKGKMDKQDARGFDSFPSSDAPGTY